MNVTIEVVAAEAYGVSVCATVTALIKSVFKVVTLISVVATSVVRSIMAFGSTSRSAVAPHNFITIGGTAVA